MTADVRDALRPGAQSAALAARSDAPRRLVILGATGSIGQSVASVIAGAPGQFLVRAVAGGRDAQALAKTAIALGAEFAALADPDSLSALKEALGGSGIRAGAGPEAIIEAALYECDLVVAAIAGAAGVLPTHAALEAGRTVALANKETLVCAGGPVMRTAHRTGAQILPMDSEHNAIFQALLGHDLTQLDRMILTASGGPFRTWSAQAIAAATPAQALNHPNWSMGSKVTIDSASLMNKGLELIEAHHLFGIAADRLDVLVHPQSIIHGLVTFTDGAVIAGMAVPDMQVPISHCLAYPKRVATGARKLDLAALGALTFEPPDFERFPALRVARHALAEGGALPTVLNAANEIAVGAFLAGRILFNDIARLVEAVCNATVQGGMAGEPDSVEASLFVDHVSRKTTEAML